MGILNTLSNLTGSSRTKSTGSFAVNRNGALVASTLGVEWSRPELNQIGQTVLTAFAQAREGHHPLTEMTTTHGGFKITARELSGGALVFLQSETPAASYNPKLPDFDMQHAAFTDFAVYLETYVECWKQFNHYLGLARCGKYTEKDEAEFLELKSLITQGLEVILAAVEQGAPRKDEVMALIVAAPSLHYLAEHNQSLFHIEGQWHKLFLVMQSLLGRLRLVQQKREREWSLVRFFRRK